MDDRYYRTKIEDEGFSFELEMRDPNLRGVYDMDPEYCRYVLRKSILGALRDLHVSEYPELRKVFHDLDEESRKAKEEAVESFIRKHNIS